VLGSQWTDYEQLLRPFALFFFTFCLFALVSDAFVATGQVRVLFWFDLISTVIIVGLLLSINEASLETMAWARGWLAVITTIALLILLEKRTHYRLSRLGALCGLILVPCLIALWTTNFIGTAFAPYTPALNLALLTVMFGSFAGCLLLLTCLVTHKKYEELGHLWRQAHGLISSLKEPIRKP